MDSTQSQAAIPAGIAAANELPPRSPMPVWELDQPLAAELYQLAEGALSGLTLDEFVAALAHIGAKHNFGQAPGTRPARSVQADYYRALRLTDLALAQGCALGREPAWQRFLALYRAQVLQAAIAIGGSATAGHELADSLTADLFGLREHAGIRTSPLASYSGRGSLLGWLRTTLAQRHVDRHRRTRRETPLGELEPAAQPATETPAPAELTQLAAAITRTLAHLPAEDRYLLAAYFLDRQTLAALGRILKVHEATVSRRLKRLTEDVHKQLLANLQAAGLSRRAAQERLGTDPRDLELNLRAALQTSQVAAFPVHDPLQGRRG